MAWRKQSNRLRQSCRLQAILRISAILQAAWNVEGGAGMLSRFHAGAVSLAAEHLGHQPDSVDLE
jgi:hypothetical protein